MPLWLKILAPSLLVVFLVFGTLLATGVIEFSSMFKTSVEVPEGYTIVPNIEGMDTDAATEELAKNKLNYTTGGSVTSDYIAANLIVFQDPESGRIIPINSLVQITVSRGTGVVAEAENGISTVPIFLWCEEEVALQDFATAGLTTTVEYIFDENVAAGQVIRVTDLSGNDIEAGMELPEGTEVIVYVSKGPEGFAMPNVVGYTESDAKRTLEQAGLVVNIVYEENSSTSAGTVLSQSVSAGTTVTLGTTITIHVATAPETQATTEAPQNIFATSTPTPTPTPLPDLTVSFDPAGGSAVSSITRTYGDAIGTLPSTTREGYTFSGWVYGGSAVSSSTVVTSNMTVIATWTPNTYTVTFDSNGGSAVSSITREFGETIGSLPNTSREGYTFEGWYSDGSSVRFDTVVKSNMSLTASWTINTYNISFDSAGGSSVNGFTRNYGETLGSLPTPTRTGYTFNGWTSGGSSVNSSTTVTSDMSLTASWTINTYTITFDSNGGSSVGSITRNYGSTLGSLTSPRRDYYTFTGWTYNGSSVNINTTVTSNMTLKAGWSENGWNNWSGWSRNAVSEQRSDGLLVTQVESRNIAATYRTQYHYERAVNRGYQLSWPWRSGDCQEWEETEWLDSALPITGWEYIAGTTYGSDPVPCYGCGYDRNGNTGGLQCPWWSERTRQVEATPAYTEYRYRTRIK